MLINKLQNAKPKKTYFLFLLLSAFWLLFQF